MVSEASAVCMVVGGLAHSKWPLLHCGSERKPPVSNNFVRTQANYLLAAVIINVIICAYSCSDRVRK